MKQSRGGWTEPVLENQGICHIVQHLKVVNNICVAKMSARNIKSRFKRRQK